MIVFRADDSKLLDARLASLSGPAAGRSSLIASYSAYKRLSTCSRKEEYCAPKSGCLLESSAEACSGFSEVVAEK